MRVQRPVIVWLMIFTMVLGLTLARSRISLMGGWVITWAEISSCLKLKNCSEEWERGPWPISCKRAVAMPVLSIPSNSFLPISFTRRKCSRIRSITCIDPREWVNRVWFALGYTNGETPSWVMWRSLWNSGVDTISFMNGYLSSRMKSWTGSLTLISFTKPAWRFRRRLFFLSRNRRRFR